MRSNLTFLLHAFYETRVLPNAAGIIFRARNDGITFVVEGATENFVLVTLAWVST